MATTPGIKPGAFLPRWYGRLGNNIQQISNAIYYCNRNSIYFDMAPHPFINDIVYNFGETRQPGNIDKWSYFFYFNGPECDFPEIDIEKLNKNRKQICQYLIFPKLKLDIDKIRYKPFDDKILVIHLRSGDAYSSPHPDFRQNPLMYYVKLVEMYGPENIYVLSEDRNCPINTFFMRLNIPIHILDEKESYSVLLRATNLASSGTGTYVVSAALCSPNIKRFYCTDIWFDTGLNASMLKDYIEVYCMPIDSNKYIKKGEWDSSIRTLNKILTYTEDTSFRRL
jgi:hypothetical protein